MMNAFQFASVRSMLGLSSQEMGAALGLKKTTIIFLETGAAFYTGPEGYKTHGERQTLDHIIAFACGWMLFNGGPLVPWPREEDAHHLRLLRKFHKMNNEEMAALMAISLKELTFWFDGSRGVPNRHVMAVCWMRIFGTKNPFTFMQEGERGPEVLPMILPGQFSVRDLRGRGRIIEADSETLQ